jgi:hypothetical protein
MGTFKKSIIFTLDVLKNHHLPKQCFQTFGTAFRNDISKMHRHEIFK